MHPIFNLYNSDWPILAMPPALPPAKFVEGGVARDSMIGSGTIVSGAEVLRSVVGGNVRILGGSRVEGSVIMPGVRIGRSASSGTRSWTRTWWSPDGARIGVDLAEERSRFTVTPTGITVIGKGVTVDH